MEKPSLELPMAQLTLRAVREKPGGCIKSTEQDRLYEHAREGLSARPRLDVEALSGRELERRRGPLREGDLNPLCYGQGEGAGGGVWAPPKSSPWLRGALINRGRQLQVRGGGPAGLGGALSPRSGRC
uniref:Uncharacterized protein n=1 Tax=Anser brachyrhynchus TaxID=132585 RepID=A0A8B9D2H0_9AVES